MGNGQWAVHRLHQKRLVVAMGVGAGSAVAGVADGVVAGEGGHRGGREHVGHQAAVLVAANAAAVADCNAGGLLAAVLQREETEEGQLGNALSVRSGDAEDAALLLRALVIGEVDGLRANVDGCLRKH